MIYKDPSAPPLHHFFRNYNRVVGIAYGAIVLGLFLGLCDSQWVENV